MFPEWGEIPFLLTEEKMMITTEMQLLEIETVVNGVVIDTTPHPGRGWKNLVAFGLQHHDVPGGTPVRLRLLVRFDCFGTQVLHTVEQDFNW